MIQKIKIWMDLVRFSHTIFALPFAFASMFVAANGLPELSKVIGIVLCMVTARNAAMAFNRVVDRKIDAKNPRTAIRHLPSGIVSVYAVVTFIIVNSVLFIATSFFLNDLAGMLSLPTLIVLLSYSLWKRFSWACHLFLGFAIGLSPLGAWVAISGELHAFPALLGLALSFWIAGFDMIYATQDFETDKRDGVHSAVVRFGVDGALLFSKLLHLGLFIVLGFISFYYVTGNYWLLATGLCGLLLVFIHWKRKSNSLDGMNQDFFWANAIISVLLLLALLAEVFLSNLSI